MVLLHQKHNVRSNRTNVNKLKIKVVFFIIRVPSDSTQLQDLNGVRSTGRQIIKVENSIMQQ